MILEVIRAGATNLKTFKWSNEEHDSIKLEKGNSA